LFIKITYFDIQIIYFFNYFILNCRKAFNSNKCERIEGGKGKSAALGAQLFANGKNKRKRSF
jgi:hypothetical protein